MPTAFNIFAMPLLARAIRATSVNTKDLPAGYEFDPRQFFASGEQGAWYDPSDFSTLYQDSAGTTPVTAVGQPVGLMLDKRLGLALGAELVSNPGPFTTTTGWTGSAAVLSVSSGALVVTNSVGGTFAKAQSSITTVAGKFYAVQYTAGAHTSAAAGALWIGTSIGGSQLLALSGTNGTRKTAVFLAQGTTTYIQFIGSSVLGETVSATLGSIKEIAGNHAYQTTAASRPTVEARVNLTTNSEGAAATWTASNVVNAATPIDGFSASLQFGDNAVARYAYKSVTLALGTIYTTSIFVQMDDGNAPVVGINNTSGDFCIVSDGFNNTATATVQRISGNIYRVWSARTATTGGATRNCGVVKYTGQSARTFRVIGIQVEEGTTATTYQKVNTATDYVDVGAPRYLQFDGTDDGMVTPSINFTGTDKMTVWAGVRKLSDAAIGFIAELSANAATNTGAFYLIAPGTAGSASYGFNSRGTISAQSVRTGYASPHTAVLTGQGEISTDTSIVRVNGSQSSVSTDQGTGNYGNYPLYIGRRGGTSLPFNGRIYQLIVRGAESNAGQIAAGEAWCNSKTRAY